MRICSVPAFPRGTLTLVIFTANAFMMYGGAGRSARSGISPAESMSTATIVAPTRTRMSKLLPSGHYGEKEKRGEQHEMNGALHEIRPSGRQRDGSDEKRQGEQHDAFRVEPKRQGQAEHERRRDDDRHRQSDARQGRAEREIHARLQAVRERRAGGGDGFRQHDE